MAAKKIALIVEIWRDINQHIWVYVLLFFVVLSAFSVIYFTHLNRQTTSALEVLLTERDGLDIEWRNLVIEQSALSEHNRIENLVKTELNMHRPEPNEEIVVRVK